MCVCVSQTKGIKYYVTQLLLYIYKEQKQIDYKLLANVDCTQRLQK